MVIVFTIVFCQAPIQKSLANSEIGIVGADAFKIMVSKDCSQCLPPRCLYYGSPYKMIGTISFNITIQSGQSFAIWMEISKNKDFKNIESWNRAVIGYIENPNFFAQSKKIMMTGIMDLWHDNPLYARFCIDQCYPVKEDKTYSYIIPLRNIGQSQ